MPSAPSPYRDDAAPRSRARLVDRIRYWPGAGLVPLVVGLGIVGTAAFLARREDRLPSMIVCTTARVPKPAPPPVSPLPSPSACGCGKSAMTLGSGVTFGGNVVVNGNVTVNGDMNVGRGRVSVTSHAADPRAVDDPAAPLANLCIVHDAREIASRNTPCSATPAALDALTTSADPLQRPRIFAVGYGPASASAGPAIANAVGRATNATTATDASEGIDVDAARALLEQCVQDGDALEAAGPPPTFVPPRTVQILILARDFTASLLILALGLVALVLFLARRRVVVDIDAATRSVQVRDRGLFGTGEPRGSLALDRIEDVVVGTASLGAFAGHRLEIVQTDGRLVPLTARYFLFTGGVHARAARLLCGKIEAARRTPPSAYEE